MGCGDHGVPERVGRLPHGIYETCGRDTGERGGSPKERGCPATPSCTMTLGADGAYTVRKTYLLAPLYPHQNGTTPKLSTLGCAVGPWLHSSESPKQVISSEEGVRTLLEESNSVTGASDWDARVKAIINATPAAAASQSPKGLDARSWRSEENSDTEAGPCSAEVPGKHVPSDGFHHPECLPAFRARNARVGRWT